MRCVEIAYCNNNLKDAIPENFELYNKAIEISWVLELYETCDLFIKLYPKEIFAKTLIIDLILLSTSLTILIIYFILFKEYKKFTLNLIILIFAMIFSIIIIIIIKLFGNSIFSTEYHNGLHFKIKIKNSITLSICVILQYLIFMVTSFKFKLFTMIEIINFMIYAITIFIQDRKLNLSNKNMLHKI
jgi:hypothetical protein